MTKRAQLREKHPAESATDARFDVCKTIRAQSRLRNKSLLSYQVVRPKAGPSSAPLPFMCRHLKTGGTSVRGLPFLLIFAQRIGLLYITAKTQPHCHFCNLLFAELRHLLSDLERPFLVHMSLREDEVDFLKMATGGLNMESVKRACGVGTAMTYLWVEEIGKGQSTQVDDGKEEVGTCGV